MLDQCLGGKGLTSGELRWRRTESKTYFGMKVGELSVVGSSGVDIVCGKQLK
jgi:hypothetical protein